MKDKLLTGILFLVIRPKPIFFNSGLMLAIFHLFVNIPSLNDTFTIVVISFMMYGARSFNTHDGTGSLPHVLASILLIILSTSSSVNSS